MTAKEQAKNTNNDVATDIIGGAATALTYTNEEIKDILPPGEANEFIELRNKVLSSLKAGKQNYSVGYEADEDISLAAEDETVYE